MAVVETGPQPQVASQAIAGLDISIRTGSGEGHTLLSAFDNALQGAGVANFNLITLSSVIPTGSRIRSADEPLPGGHGDLLFCVRAEAFAGQPGDVAWAGLGWCVDETGGGLFVEHHGVSEKAVRQQIEASLADMSASRGGGYGPVQTKITSAECSGLPVCALVVAAFRVSSWHDPGEPPAEPAPSSSAGVAEDGASEPDPHWTRTGQPDRLPDPLPDPLPDRQPEPAVAVHDLGVDELSVNGASARQSHGQTVFTAPSSEPPIYDSSVVSQEAPASFSGRVTVEKEVDYATARLYYALYRDTFGELETTAVARQILHESEFLEEMLNPKVHKYVAWDDYDRAIGMTTLTTDLSTVPWISPGYFAKHYPDHHARGAIYYLGFTLVRPDHRGAHVFHAMIEPMARLILADRGVCAWDMCLANDARGLGGSAAILLKSLADVTIDPIDRQSYYAATFHGPLTTDDGAGTP